MPIDPRAHSTEKLTAPAPLPFVSRACLARVTDWMPPPTECRYCRVPVVLVNNSEIYGREYGDWPYLYLCRKCNSYVGLHPKTDLPLGTLATKELRGARSKSKEAFHAMLKELGIGRGDGYALVSAGLDIPLERCHFGWFEIPQCEEVKHFCNKQIMKKRHPLYCK